MRVGVGFADQAQGQIDMTESFHAAAGAGWRRAEISLSRLTDNPEDLSSVTAPLVIESEGPFTMKLSDAALEMPSNRADCAP